MPGSPKDGGASPKSPNEGMGVEKDMGAEKMGRGNEGKESDEEDWE
jgi:hypothetical protein